MIAGMQSAVVEKCEWNCEHTWLLSESDYRVALSDDVKGK